MAIRSYIRFANNILPINLAKPVLFRQASIDVAAVSATSEAASLYHAIKKKDHFVISEAKTGTRCEVTFAWLRDHCR